MKDLIIPAKRIRTELLILMVSFVFSNLLNVYAIWRYDTSWVELLTFQRMVLAISLSIYIVSVVARGLVYLIRSSYRRLTSQRRSA